MIRWLLPLGLVAASCSPRASDQSALSPPPTTGLEAPGAILHVDPDRTLGAIAPSILGMSGELDEGYRTDVGVTLASWGGNTATRYNFMLGNAWNSGSDWAYRNGDFGFQGDAAREFLAEAQRSELATRFAIPTLGWVAKDTDNSTCSFPDQDGNCGDAQGANCAEPQDQVAPSPESTSVAIDSQAIGEWLEALLDERLLPDIIAFDNEPELWGYTHFDVHPDCTTYEEVFDRHVAYSTAVHDHRHGRLESLDLWRVAGSPTGALRPAQPKGPTRTTYRGF